MTNNLNEVINKFYWYDLQDKVSILVYATEAKQVYGRTDILISPIFGTGGFWKSLDKLRLVSKGNTKINEAIAKFIRNVDSLDNLTENGELTNV